jgi:hypothetical protein
LGYAKAIGEAARGKYLVGVCDLHSNMDALSALRDPRTCLDILDCPELLDEAMRGVRKLYPFVYDSIREASGIDLHRLLGLDPLLVRRRFAVLQCDFMCMVGPDAFDRFIRPALEEEAAFLDHCVVHVDGVGALRHLDGILS